MNFNVNDSAFHNDELKTKILTAVQVSKQEAINICINTLGQSEKFQWFEERKVRLTASIFGKVMNRGQNFLPEFIDKMNNW